MTVTASSLSFFGAEVAGCDAEAKGFPSSSSFNGSSIAFSEEFSQLVAEQADTVDS